MAEFRLTELTLEVIKYRRIDEEKIGEALNNPAALVLDQSEPGLCRSSIEIDPDRTLIVLFYNNKVPWVIKSAFITRKDK